MAGTVIPAGRSHELSAEEFAKSARYPAALPKFLGIVENLELLS
jgi:hypothetical protein